MQFSEKTCSVLNRQTDVPSRVGGILVCTDFTQFDRNDVILYNTVGDRAIPMSSKESMVQCVLEKKL